MISAYWKAINNKSIEETDACNKNYMYVQKIFIF